MILGIGSDLVEIRRISASLEQFGDRFAERCFSDTERERASSAATPELKAASYAKRWAAKEAVAKALGLGIADGVHLRDISVVLDASGRPGIELSGGAQKRLETIKPQGARVEIHISLSDDAGFALAFAVISAVVEG